MNENDSGRKSVFSCLIKAAVTFYPLRMAEFLVSGPYEIPFEQRPGGRILLHKEFWKQDGLEELGIERGCYIFAIRAGKGMTPIYVGKATRSFKQECLNASNRHKFSNGMADYQKGTPVLYLVRHPAQRGKTNAKQIGEIENFLIQNAAVKNPEIQNLRGKAAPKWSIRGVIRSGQGKPSKAESDLKRLIGIPG